MKKTILIFKNGWYIFESIYKKIGIFSGVFVIIMMLGVTREVIGRYFFNTPTNWVLELSGYLLVGLVFLGAPYTETIDGHVRVDFLYRKFSGKIKSFVDIVISLISISWCGILVWKGGEIAYDSWKFGIRSSDTMMWPLFYSQILVPIGCFLVILVLAANLVKAVRIFLKIGK